MSNFDKNLSYKEQSIYKAMARAENMPLTHFYASLIRLGAEVYEDDMAGLKGHLSNRGLKFINPDVVGNGTTQ